MVDFEDLLYLTNDLLSAHPQIREKLQRYWKHVLVDEYQDTSKIQTELVKSLSSSSLLVVGDADQCIYSFRGAFSGSMSKFVENFQHVHTLRLIENYRSTFQILKATQNLMNDAPSCSSACENADFRQQAMPMRGDEGPKPQVLSFIDAGQQAKFVVQEINDLLKDKLGPNPTIAILYRTHIQSRELEDACILANIPCKIHGRSRFYLRAEVADCLCFLRIIAGGGSEQNEIAMLRAFRTPNKGIGEKAMDEFAKYCEQVELHCKVGGKSAPSLLDVLISLTDFQRDPAKAMFSANAPTPHEWISMRALESLQKFSAVMHQLREIAYASTLEQLLLAVIDKLDLRSHVAKTYADDEFEKRWENVEKLIHATQQYSDVAPCCRPRCAEFMDFDNVPIDERVMPLEHFLDVISPDSDIDVEDDSNDDEKRCCVVQLMTIHAAKGKEFDAVFIVGNEEGTLPIRQRGGARLEHIDEERRLCYVAMTRAKTYLYITRRQNVVSYSGFVEHPPISRFLKNISGEGVASSVQAR